MNKFYSLCILCGLFIPFVTFVVMAVCFAMYAGKYRNHKGHEGRHKGLKEHPVEMAYYLSVITNLSAAKIFPSSVKRIKYSPLGRFSRLIIVDWLLIIAICFTSCPKEL